jgi:hypothetical protein
MTGFRFVLRKTAQLARETRTNRIKLKNPCDGDILHKALKVE